jgi:hypothetical protein
VTRPDDLNPKQREVFETWRSIGLTEAAALNAMVEDGVIQLSDEEKVARNLRGIFPTLTESQSLTAARSGRDSGSARPVSEGSSSRTEQGDAVRLIGIIEAWSQDLLARGQLCVERGETREQAALQEAFSKVFLNARNMAESAWILGVATARWPELSSRHSARFGGVSKTQTRSVGETTRQPGRRTVSGG